MERHHLKGLEGLEGLALSSQCEFVGGNVSLGLDFEVENTRVVFSWICQSLSVDQDVGLNCLSSTIPAVMLANMMIMD